MVDTLTKPVKVCQKCWDYGYGRKPRKPKGRIVSTSLVSICKPSECQSIYHAITNGGK